MTSYFGQLQHFLENNPQYLPTSDEKLEETLENLLCEEELLRLNLPLFLRPRILRKLPRTINILSRSTQKIKAPFTELKVLKRHLIDKALLYFYDLYAPPPQGSLILLTWAYPDGRGDLSAAHYALHFLQTFPHLDITPILFTHKDFPHPPPHALHYTQYPGQPPQLLPYPDAILEKWKTAHCIFEFPTAFPLLDTIYNMCPHAHFERLGEHSLIEATQFHPQHARCMGLHFLEKGIFIKKTLNRDFSDLQSPYLRCLLGKNRFNLAYTKTLRGTLIYLLTLLYAFHDESFDLDLCVFPLPALLLSLQEMQHDAPFLQGIKEFLIYTPNSKTAIPLASCGKTIRIIHADHLCHEDLLTLNALSLDLIGCTGDQSILEAISTLKPFFYDPPPFKRLFLTDLITIAQAYLPQHRELIAFLSLQLKNPQLPLPEPDAGFVSEDTLFLIDQRLQLEEDSDQQIAYQLGQLLKSPTLQTGFEQLHTILSQYYPLETNLRGLVKRGFLHQKAPHLAVREHTSMSAWIEGKISAETCLSKIQEMLQTLETPLHLLHTHSDVGIISGIASGRSSMQDTKPSL